MRWLKNGISKFGSLWYLTADKYRDGPQNVRKVMNNRCLDDLARIKLLYPIQAHFFGSGRANICFLVNPGRIYSLQYQMESPLSILQVPLTLCRRFDSSVQKEDSISRDWLVQLWLAEKRKENVRRKGKRRSVQNVQIGDPVSEALPFFQLPSMRSVLSSLVPDEHEMPVKGTVKQPPISQYDGRFLSPSSPDEIKLEPLLARANLLITRDIEWANIMFAFEQESRYMIVDPCYPQSPAGSIREQSNLVFRQLLRTRRPFVARITDAMGNEIFRVRRPFWLINSTIYAEVDGKEVGVVHRRWHLWRRIYDLYLGNKQFAVVENPGFWNWTFTLKDDNDNVLAQIDRDWRGFGFELFTDAGQYVIRFGDADSHSKPGLASAIQSLEISHPLTLSERAVTVALAVSLDCDYFSRSHGGWGLPVLIAGE